MPKIKLSIAQESDIKVKSGQKIKKGDLLAVSKNKGDLRPIDLPLLVGANVKKVNELFTKKQGTEVEEGEILIKKGGALGLSTTVVFSPISGTIESYDVNTGILSIRQKGKEAKILAKLDGEITEVSKDFIEITTDNKIFQGKRGQGEDITGVLAEGSTLDKIITDKIILLDKLTKLSLSKALGLGALGIVTLSVDEEYLLEFKEKGFKISLLEIEEEDFKLLQAYIGKEILLAPSEKFVIVL